MVILALKLNVVLYMGYVFFGRLFYIGYRQGKKRMVYFDNEEILEKTFGFVWEKER